MNLGRYERIRDLRPALIWISCVIFSAAESSRVSTWRRIVQHNCGTLSLVAKCDCAISANEENTLFWSRHRNCDQILATAKMGDCATNVMIREKMEKMWMKDQLSLVRPDKVCFFSRFPQPNLLKVSRGSWLVYMMGCNGQLWNYLQIEWVKVFLLLLHLSRFSISSLLSSSP